MCYNEFSRFESWVTKNIEILFHDKDIRNRFNGKVLNKNGKESAIKI